MGMSLFLAKTPSNIGFLVFLAEAPQFTLQGPLESSRLVQLPVTSPAFPYGLQLKGKERGRIAACGEQCSPESFPLSPFSLPYSPRGQLKGEGLGGLQGNPSCTVGATVRRRD